MAGSRLVPGRDSLSLLPLSKDRGPASLYVNSSRFSLGTGSRFREPLKPDARLVPRIMPPSHRVDAMLIKRIYNGLPTAMLLIVVALIQLLAISAFA